LKASKEIRQVFPKAHLIAIYRDGRDVAVSYHFHNLRLRDFRKYRNKVEAEAAYQHHIDGGKQVVPLLHRPTLNEACRDWVQCNTSVEIARQEFGERFLITSYEQLWADPVPFLTQVFSSLEVRCDRALVESIARSKTFSSVTKGRAPGVMDPRSFYRTGKPGDWRNYFTAQSAAWFNENCGDWLIRLGYSSTLDWWREIGSS
jgi:LPS sulfotransferase NodH